MPRKPACHSVEKIFDTMSYRPTAVCRSTRRAAHCSCPRVWLNPVADEMLGRHNRLVGRWNNSSYTDWSACRTRECPRSENFGHVGRCRCIAQLVISAHTDGGWNPSVLLSRKRQKRAGFSANTAQMQEVSTATRSCNFPSALVCRVAVNPCLKTR